MKKTLSTLVLSISFFSFAWVVSALPVPADFIHNNANRAVDFNVAPVVADGFVLGDPPVINFKAGILMMHDRAITRLDKVKDYIERNRTLSVQERQKVLSKVSEGKKAFKERKKMIEDRPDLDQRASDGERSVSASVWGDYSVQIYWAIMNGRIADKQNILNKTKAVVTKLEIYINLAKKIGANTDIAENNLAKIKVSLVSAETNLKEAKINIDRAGFEWGDAKEFFKTANKDLKKANEDIKEIKSLSKEVVKELRKVAK